MNENEHLPSFFEQFHPAGFWVRNFAIILDIFFFVLIALTIELINRSFINLPEIILLKSPLVLLYGIYTIYLISSKLQATFGQRIMCIYIGDENQNRIPFTASFKRFVFLFISCLICGISLLTIILNRENLTPHDYFCDTRVFYGKK
jgi:uncharacterized RDD family membrane protein YckC